MWLIIEGLDGSGKSTAIEILRQELEAQGKTVVVTQGIGTGKIGSYLREEIIENCNLTKEMEVLAFPLALLDCLREIKDYLDLDYTVITDRFIASYWAYAKNSYFTDQIYNYLIDQVYAVFTTYEINKHTIYINSTIETCMQRIAGRGDKKYFDNESSEEFSRVSTRYSKWLEATPSIKCISNSDDLEEFKTRLINQLNELQGNK